MAEQRLNQLLAVEKGLKQRIEQYVTQLYHTAQKSALFDGMSRTYKPLTEGGERLPPETKLVQQRAMDVLTETATTMTELFDVRAVIDRANCDARADVVVNGQALLTDVPATYLLFLEKKLTDVHTIVSKLPVLDPAEAWALDASDQLFKTSVTETARTAKVQEPIVLQPPTKEHPAQTAIVNKDIIVGYYEMVKSLGGLAPGGAAAYLAAGRDAAGSGQVRPRASKPRCRPQGGGGAEDFRLRTRRTSRPGVEPN